MTTKQKKVKYPDNLYLRKLVVDSGRSVTSCAEELKVSRLVLSQTINGHYKGINVVPRLLEIIGKPKN